MNQANVAAAGAASDYGIAVLAAIAVFFGDASQSLGVTVGFGLVAVLAISVVIRVLNDWPDRRSAAEPTRAVDWGDASDYARGSRSSPGYGPSSTSA